MVRPLRPYVLPVVAGVLAFSVVYTGIFYLFGGDAWAWYWWPFYPIGAITIAFLAAGWASARERQRPAPGHR